MGMRHSKGSHGSAAKPTAQVSASQASGGAGQASTPSVAVSAPVQQVVPKPPPPRSTPVSAPRATALLSIAVCPHVHTVFCDRKRVVCTAEGSIREGNRLIAAWRGDAGYAVGTWYRCKQRPLIAVNVPLRLPEDAPTFFDVFASVDAHADPLQALRIPSLPHVSITPPVDAEATYTAIMGSDCSGHGVGRDSILSSTAAAIQLSQCEAMLAHASAEQYLCTRDDVGTYLAYVRKGGPDGAAVACVVGPVEAAPPRIREMWISGAPTVGSALIPHAWYYGGHAGSADWVWIRVDGDGNRTELPPRQGNPQLEGMEGATNTGLAYVLRPEDMGCTFKVSCEPVRSDGVKGAPSTSRPTATVT